MTSRWRWIGGRERAPVVLVAELPSQWSYVPTYEIRSAGDEDPVGEPVERMRPGAGQETLEWAFSTRLAATGEEPRQYAEQLEAALDEDETVSVARCEFLAEEPMAWSFPRIITADGEERQPPPIRGWVDVNFHIVAPTRKSAFEAALAALHRAFPATDQTHGRVGNFELRAVG